jgi:hypothetical protein
LLSKTLSRSREPDAHGIRGDAEDLAGFGLTETVPDQQAKEFLIIGSQPGQGLEGWRLDGMDRRDMLWLGAESKAEPQAAAGPSALVGEDAARGSQEPGQGHVGFRQAIDTPPCDSERLRYGVLGVGLALGPAEGECQDRAVMLLEGRFEAAQIRGAHLRRTTSSLPEFRPAAQASAACGARALPPAASPWPALTIGPCSRPLALSLPSPGRPSCPWRDRGDHPPTRTASGVVTP